ncbi:MAG: hypothetical protein R2708_28715 [Vicinamibacterales bacterium]
MSGETSSTGSKATAGLQVRKAAEGRAQRQQTGFRAQVRRILVVAIADGAEKDGVGGQAGGQGGIGQRHAARLDAAAPMDAR